MTNTAKRTDPFDYHSDSDPIRLELGQWTQFPAACGFDAAPNSKVVGKDSYRLNGGSGPLKAEFNSYTMQPQSSAPVKKPWGNRWWIFNLPKIGPHFFHASNQLDDAQKQTPIFDLSGKIKMHSEGDSTVSGGTNFATGEIKAYSLDDGQIYIEETLDQVPDKTICFVGGPYRQP